MSHEKIAATFDEWARTDRTLRMQEGHEDVGRQVIARMGVRPGEAILDLGCGHGWATRLLGAAAPGSQAVGVDVSRSMLRRAEELHDLTARARYEHGKFEELDFAGDRFHRIFSMEALYYAVDLGRSLGEMLRVLKPGGTADVVVNRFEESPHSARWDALLGVDMHFLGADQWRAAFERAGFVNVRTERLRDSRGPGSEADFETSEHCPDWKTQVELHEAGSLWIHAEKPA